MSRQRSARLTEHCGLFPALDLASLEGGVDPCVPGPQTSLLAQPPASASASQIRHWMDRSLCID